MIAGLCALAAGAVAVVVLRGSPAPPPAPMTPALTSADLGPIAPLPAPPLLAPEPAWPVSPVPMQLPEAPSLPAPDLPRPPAPATSALDALAAPPSAVLPRQIAVESGGEFVARVLALRRGGLDLALVVQYAASDEAVRSRLNRLVDAVRAIVPRARIGAVVYAPTGVRVVPLGSDPEGRAGALASAPVTHPAGEATGLGEALTEAARLDWRDDAAPAIIVLASAPPWIGEIVAAQTSARVLQARTKTNVHLLVIRPPAADKTSGLTRLLVEPSFDRTDVPVPAQLDVEALTLLLGKEHRPRIEKLVRDLEE